MEKKVTINGKEFVVRELSYLEALELDFDKDKKVESIKQLLKICVNLTDEEISKLTAKEGIELQKVINEVNGLTDFQ